MQKCLTFIVGDKGRICKIGQIGDAKILFEALGMLLLENELGHDNNCHAEIEYFS